MGQTGASSATTTPADRASHGTQEGVNAARPGRRRRRRTHRKHTNRCVCSGARLGGGRTRERYVHVMRREAAAAMAWGGALVVLVMMVCGCAMAQETSVFTGEQILSEEPFVKAEWVYNASASAYRVLLTSMSDNWIGVGFSGSCKMFPAVSAIATETSNGQVAAGLYSLSSHSMSGVTESAELEGMADISAKQVADGIVQARKLSVLYAASGDTPVPVIWAIGGSPLLGYHPSRGCFTIE